MKVSKIQVAIGAYELGHLIQGLTNFVFKGSEWDFPGGPVVRTLCFHCRGPRFDPWVGAKILPATQHGQKRKKKKRKFKASESKFFQL